MDKSEISSHTLVEEERIINTKFGEEKPEFPTTTKKHFVRSMERVKVPLSSAKVRFPGYGTLYAECDPTSSWLGRGRLYVIFVSNVVCMYAPSELSVQDYA